MKTTMKKFLNVLEMFMNMFLNGFFNKKSLSRMGKGIKFFMAAITPNTTPHGLTIKTVIHHVIAVLKLPRRIDDIILKMQAVITSMTGNTWFPTPDPPVVDLQSAVTDLSTAEADVKAHVANAVHTRDVKLAAAKILFLQETKGYIQSIADANPESAIEIIKSAGVDAKHVKPRVPREFGIKAYSIGTVEITGSTKGSTTRRGNHEWGLTLTPDNPTSWGLIPVASTTKGIVIFGGLTSGTKIYARHRFVGKNGPSDWDGPLGVTVP